MAKEPGSAMTKVGRDENLTDHADTGGKFLSTFFNFLGATAVRRMSPGSLVVKFPSGCVVCRHIGSTSCGEAEGCTD